MKKEIDIHNYSKRLKSHVNTVKNANISKRNKDLIFKFQEQLVLDNIGQPRICKYLEILKIKR